MLLDHTAFRAMAPGLGLVGTKGAEPEVTLDERGFVLTGRDVPAECWTGGLPPANASSRARASSSGLVKHSSWLPGQATRRYRPSRSDSRGCQGRLCGPTVVELIALDEHGKNVSTREFAELLKVEAAFVIGGADGLPDEIKNEAALTLRLSSMTLPHALAQVVLIEQIYRAASILTGHPYHRE